MWLKTIDHNGRHQVEFGIFDHMEHRGTSLQQLYEERLQMLEFADANGFARYHKAEHHFTPLDDAPSSAVFLAAASQRTKRIRLGSLVQLLPFYHPIRLIEEVCALDHLTGGRLDVGVGKGISPIEHALWGQPAEEARARADETLTILRQGLTADRLTYRGTFHTFVDVPLRMAPLQLPHPPLWYPGNVELAGAHRLNTVVGGPTAAVAAQAQRYRQLLDAPTADWNPAVRAPVIGATRHMFIAATREEAHARARGAWRQYDANLAQLWRAHGVQPTGAPSMNGDFDRAVAFEVLLAGTPEAVVTHIRGLQAQAGIDYCVGAFAWGDLQHAEVMRSLELFVAEVMPHL